VKPSRSAIKRWYCDNCGRKHWGYYERVSGGWEFPDEWDFVATTRDGNPRTYMLPNGEIDRFRTGQALCV
jgi:hypothetical protein